MTAARRVLLTGVGGFVGSQLGRQLVNAGHEVTALLSPSTDRRRMRDFEGRIRVLDSDLRGVEGLAGAIREGRPEICIHLAWHGWAGQAEPEENLTSLSLAMDLLKLMPHVGCERFVAAGTCFEYDLGGDRLSEETPLRPLNIYALCKKAMYEVSQEFAAVAPVRSVTPRLFYSYGPFEDRRRVVPSIVLSLLRGEAARVTPGEQVRDYLHVEDVASAIWATATSDATGAVNIASGEPVTVAEVAVAIGELVGRPDLIELGALPYREGDPMRVLADATKLRGGIGWSPKYTLREGLAQTIEWWRGAE